jgi:succinoglycan biosynthesis transport protein ExoP
VSLFQFLSVLWARRLMIILCTVAAVAAAFVISLTLTPRYQATSRLMLSLSSPDPVTGEMLPGNLTKSFTRTQTELVRDYRVAGLAVEKLGWLNDPALQRAYASEPRQMEFRRWLAQRVINSSSAYPVEGSNVLEIAYTDPSPEVARAGADAVREAYEEASVALRRQRAQRSSQWYAEQAQQARVQLAQAEQIKTRFERENGLVLEGGVDLESLRLQALAGQVPVTIPGGGGGVAPSAGQLAQVEASIAAASRSVGPNHPDMLQLQQQRAALARQVAAERAAAGGGGGSTAATQSGAIAAQRSRVMANRENIERLRQLQTQVDVRREQYVRAATRAAELRREAETTETGASRLGDAVTPTEPVFPNRPLIVLGALVLGFGLGVLLALLAEMLGRRVRSIKDLNDAVDAPLLAIVIGPSSSRGILSRPLLRGPEQ